MSSNPDDPNKPVTGYPTTSYPPPQTSYNQQHQPTGYPPAQGNYPSSTANGIAYPYSAPPPTAYYNPYPPPPPNNYNPQRTTFLRRVIIVAISIFIIIASVSFIIRLAIRPHVPEFRVDSASVSNFNISSSSELSANWEIGLFIKNPNKKMIIFYDQIEGSVFYKEDPLTEKTLPPFSQNENNETKITALFTASSTYIDEGMMKEIVGDRDHGNGVTFNFRMLAWISFKSGAWGTRRHLIRVFCEDIKIGFSSNTSAAGKLLGQTKACEVDP